MYVIPEIIIFAGIVGLVFIVLGIVSLISAAVANKDNPQDLEKKSNKLRIIKDILLTLGAVLAGLSFGVLVLMLLP